MAKRNKPTIREVASVAAQLMNQVNSMKRDISALVGTLDFYIEYKGDSAEFSEYINKTLDAQEGKENELQTNEAHNESSDRGGTEDKG